ncbi:MAG: enoyl-CoA hydratase/isomerase family protein [Actinomycetota bacterium]|jgi:enoyl-CoA hydratase|nr:enoyl-CoA hydratase/isomerase family protein [Actinomycetota bacterium]
MEPLVLRADVDGVTTLTLNRPDALNALSPAMFVELRDHLEALAAAPETSGAIVLTGAGRSFSAGNDLKAIQAGERAPSAHYQAETLDLIEALPQVVIAAVKGHCYTGSLELAIACDLLICGDDVRFCDTHGRYAMVPTWGMITRLPERVGPLAARDMMYSGRVVGADEAVRIGLANRSVAADDLADAAREWAQQIAANSWHTLQHEKRMMRELGDRERQDGLRWGREEGPGAGADMVDRIKASFGR